MKDYFLKTVRLGFSLWRDADLPDALELCGKGFAVEACSAVIEYAFTRLSVEALFAGHNPKNRASEQLLGKLGFVYTHDEFYAPTGLLHPSYLMMRGRQISFKRSK